MITYRNLQSYKDIIKTGFKETTGPVQLKNGSVRFAGLSQKKSLVHYIFRYPEKIATRKNPSGAAPARILVQTSDYNTAFEAFLANITGTEKRKQTERVTWNQQLYRSKEKVFSYMFGTRPGSLENSMKSGWWDQLAGHAEDPVKRLLYIMKYQRLIEKGRDY